MNAHLFVAICVWTVLATVWAAEEGITVFLSTESHVLTSVILQICSY